MKHAHAHDFASFRAAARSLIAGNVPPARITWHDALAAQASLFAEPEAAPVATAELRVPRRYVELAQRAVLFRSPDRFDLPYRVLHRLSFERPDLLADELDDDVRELGLRVLAVRRDEHRMHAFVRFRRVPGLLDERYVAWYRPEHHSLRLGAPFFARRFHSMVWSILSPDESAHWQAGELTFGPGAARSEAPDADELEALFRTYYASTYNPARHNPKLFEKHVPRAFRSALPELHGPPVHTERPAAKPAAGADVPAVRELSGLRAAACQCDACPLAGPATQTVFGEGPAHASIVLVGEQPGDQEDLQGRPFVGPAGQLLDRALVEAGLARDTLYVTNAVKHFGYRPMGNKKRLHVKPEWRHIEACRPWLLAELEAIAPRVVVCLGASAGQSLFGRRFSLRNNRGRQFRAPWAEAVVVTHHPSAVLRMDDEARAAAYAQLVHDLALARAASMPA